MMERRLKEIELLRKKYGPVKTGNNLEWVLFEEFQFPPGWNREKGLLYLPIPSGYPVTPPDNFYVTPGLRTSSGTMPSNYEDCGHVFLGQQWARFSFHVDNPSGNWKPAADLLEGHNLLTFMLGVEKRLKETN